MQQTDPHRSEWDLLPSTLLGLLVQILQSDGSEGETAVGRVRLVCRNWLNAFDSSVSNIVPKPSRLGSVRTVEILGQRFSAVRHLDLSLLGNRVTEDSLFALQYLGKLRSLCLSGCQQVVEMKMRWVVVCLENQFLLALHTHAFHAHSKIVLAFPSLYGE